MELIRWAQPAAAGGAADSIRAVVASGQWSAGVVAQELEDKLAAAYGRRYCTVMNSGTAALWAIFAALGCSPGAEVIVPAFGYVGAAHAAASLGFRLAVADSLPEALVVDPASVRRLMAEQVRAVVGINYFGYSVGWDEMPAGEHVILIEDAAGSVGASYGGKPCGAFGAASVFSFHTSKGVPAGGEGGCVLTDDQALHDRIRLAARHGNSGGYYFSTQLGLNLLMPDLSAAIALGSLDGLTRRLRRCQGVVEQYVSCLDEAGLTPPRHLNLGHGTRKTNYQAVAVFTAERDYVLSVLRLNGVEARPCWPHLLTEQPSLRPHISRCDGQLRNARRHASLVLNLPVHQDISDGQISRITALMQRLTAVTRSPGAGCAGAG